MGFELFNPSTKTYTKNPTAAISQFGRISLNSQAVKTFGLDGYKYAALFYDKEKELIGVKFLKEKDVSIASLVSIQGRKNSGIFLAALSFLYHYEIFTKDNKFTAWFDIAPSKLDGSDEEKFFVIDLKTKRLKRKED